MAEEMPKEWIGSQEKNVKTEWKRNYYRIKGGRKSKTGNVTKAKANKWKMNRGEEKLNKYENREKRGDE